MTSPPEPSEVTDPAILKALAHPLRRRIIAELRRGPASATTVAAALGENTGATSYHLRELAKTGFIEDVPELGRGKQRWWRLVPRDLRFPRRGEQTPELAAALDRLRDEQFTEDLAIWARFQERQEELGDWADAVPYSRGSVVVTQDELKTFFDDYMALLKRHWRAPGDIPPDARRVLVRFIAFPDPD